MGQKFAVLGRVVDVGYVVHMYVKLGHMQVSSAPEMLNP